MPPRVREGLWKFIYWPLLWIVTLWLPCEAVGCTTLQSGVAVTALRIMGAVLLVWSFFLHGVAGRTLRYFGHRDPRDRSIWPDKLVVDGIYSCMRHPQHLGLSLTPVAIALLTASPTAILSSGWAVVGALLFIIFVEEPECIVKFGSDYCNYMARVRPFTLDPRCPVRGLRYLRENSPEKHSGPTTRD